MVTLQGLDHRNSETVLSRIKGRIVVPCNHNTTTSGAGRSHVIYSDDKGETWHLGGIMDVDYTNESTVTELSNGDLMLNMRKQSDTENIGWSPPVRTAD